MGTIQIYPSGKTVAYTEGDRLLDILQEAGVLLESPCGGKGTCGKCKVKIHCGTVSAPTEEERKHLGTSLAEGIRLSCLVYPRGHVGIEVLEQERAHSILTEGYMPEFSCHVAIRKEVVTLPCPTLAHALSGEDLLAEVLGRREVLDAPSLLQGLSQACQTGTGTLVYAGQELLGIEAGDTADRIYGAAVDIGTTTVVVSLVDLRNGREIASETCINPQKEYGLDVLSRIDFAKRKKEGLALLQERIIGGLNELVEKLCQDWQISRNFIYEFTVGANATMMHFLLGVPTDSIGRSPYAPVFSKSKYMAAHTVGLQGAPFARLYCLPGVSSYIGADIVAGAAVAGLEKTQQNVLFLDIGTNCEMILSRKGDMTACSCAAGPALEGANISCGMRAAEGAVEGMQIVGDEVRLQVIGSAGPCGICGSGILESIAEIWKHRLMSKSGRLKKAAEVHDEGRPALARRIVEKDKKRSFLLQDGSEALRITQADIRQVQLAKGAISSGMYALLELMGMTMDELDSVVIAGQFGRHLKVSSLTGVGIIPAVLQDKINYIGNSSRAGALLCLLSKESRDDMERIAGQIHYFELSTKKEYEKLFTQCINFS